MATRESGLLQIVGAADSGIALDYNFDLLDSDVFKLKPTLQTGVRNTITGPPTSGTWTIDKIWVDGNKARWLCTVAGTPGTWRQLEPAQVSANPAAPVNGYLIERTDQHYRRWYWDGAAWVGAKWRFKNRTTLQILNDTDGLWYTPGMDNGSGMNSIYPGVAGEA